MPARNIAESIPTPQATVSHPGMPEELFARTRRTAAGNGGGSDGSGSVGAGAGGGAGGGGGGLSATMNAKGGLTARTAEPDGDGPATPLYGSGFAIGESTASASIRDGAATSPLLPAFDSDESPPPRRARAPRPPEDDAFVLPPLLPTGPTGPLSVTVNAEGARASAVPGRVAGFGMTVETQTTVTASSTGASGPMTGGSSPSGPSGGELGGLRQSATGIVGPAGFLAGIPSESFVGGGTIVPFPAPDTERRLRAVPSLPAPTGPAPDTETETCPMCARSMPLTNMIRWRTSRALIGYTAGVYSCTDCYAEHKDGAPLVLKSAEESVTESGTYRAVDRLPPGPSAKK